MPKINRVTAGILAKNKGTVLGAGALMSSFGKKPTFLKKKTQPVPIFSVRTD